MTAVDILNTKILRMLQYLRYWRNVSTFSSTMRTLWCWSMWYFVCVIFYWQCLRYAFPYRGDIVFHGYLLSLCYISCLKWPSSLKECTPNNVVSQDRRSFTIQCYLTEDRLFGWVFTLQTYHQQPSRGPPDASHPMEAYIEIPFVLKDCHSSALEVVNQLFSALVCILASRQFRVAAVGVGRTSNWRSVLSDAWIGSDLIELTISSLYHPQTRVSKSQSSEPRSFQTD